MRSAIVALLTWSTFGFVSDASAHNQTAPLVIGDVKIDLIVDTLLEEARDPNWAPSLLERSDLQTAFLLVSLSENETEVEPLEVSTVFRIYQLVRDKKIDERGHVIADDVPFLFGAQFAERDVAAVAARLSDLKFFEERVIDTEGEP